MEQNQCDNEMKELSEFIVQSKSTDKTATAMCDMFNGTKVTKEVVVKMLMNVSSDILKSMSDEFYRRDGKNYIVYQPANDMFLANKEGCVNQMADYIVRFVAVI